MLADARRGHLALIDDRDRPRVLPVTFALAGGAIWSAIDEKPKRVAPAKLARIRYLRRRPEAAFGVDRYDEDWSRLAWVQALGRVEVVEHDADALAALAAKYAPYREREPAGPLLRLDVERTLFWRAD